MNICYFLLCWLVMGFYIVQNYCKLRGLIIVGFMGISNFVDFFICSMIKIVFYNLFWDVNMWV